MFSFKKIFISSVLLFLLGSLMHFLYELSGENFIVGLFTPVNESVWEHLKLAYFPILLWWFLNFKKADAKIRTKLLSACSSLLFAPLMTVFLFYSYSGAFGVELLWFDILILFIAIFLGLLLGNHVLGVSNPPKWIVQLLFIITVIMFFALLIFTISPPDIPIFVSPENLNTI